ncbi:MAG: YggT family protein [Candidatus Hydrogenedentes bacterium]|nr:YggT family protein [Candidatus Hydrogenedentota bacterium]
MQTEYILRAAYSGGTLYMMLILLRSIGPALGQDVTGGRMAWVSKLTDPLITRLRKVLPSMGPADFAPVASLLLVWLLRELSVNIITSYMT